METGQARVRMAVALAGGAARGLAHIGVLEVLEREGIRPDAIAGTSMGGLVGALFASGLNARDMVELARGFRFPRTFVLGGTARWDKVFRSAVPVLAGLDFERLRTPLVVTAVDLEEGREVLLREGALLPAIQATCAVPGVLPPVQLGGRWLADGGLINVLPVDVSWMFNPDVVVAVKPRSRAARPMPQLHWRLTSLLSRLGAILPNPGTAKVSFEVLVRSAEILLERATALAVAMAGPELLIEPDIGDIGLRDFHRQDDAVEAGRRAATAALPALEKLLAKAATPHASTDNDLMLRMDPVCTMVVSLARSRAITVYKGNTYCFCSTNCRDCFERDPECYASRCAGAAVSVAARSHA